jgi:hypothetical protein
MKRIAAVVALLLSSLALADNYGAIAYSPSTGATGTSWNCCDEGTAEQSAVGYCGQADCGSYVWTDNQCAALAVSSNGGWGWAGNKDRGLARANAMAQCETQGPGCHVVADVCS